MARTISRLLSMLIVLALSTGLGCHSSESDTTVVSRLQAGERTSAFRDIGKRSASDLTLR